MKGIRYPFEGVTFDIPAIRSILCGNKRKLPIWFNLTERTCWLPLVFWVNGKKEPMSYYCTFRCLPSCRLPKGDKDFYLHRLQVKCECGRWLDMNHAKQHTHTKERKSVK